MADISLTMNGIKFTFAEGECDEISSNITTDIENEKMSASGPMRALNYDYNGVAKTITIKGVLFETPLTRVAGYSITSVIEQKQWLESLANGSQTPITFTSNYETSSVIEAGGVAPYQGSFAYTKCMITSITFRENAGEPDRLSFEISFAVGE